MFDKALIDRVKGFLPEAEGEKLFEVARTASRMGACLEIGSYCGKSALYIGAACKETGGILYTIDHHRGNEEQQPGEMFHDADLVDPSTGKMDTLRFLRETLDAGSLEKTVVPMIGRSAHIARFWNTPLALVFIDGGHTFEAAYTDYVSWASHVMPGGYLLVHDIFDTHEEGGQAPRYVYELAIGSKLFEVVERVGSLGILRRRIPGELPDDLPVY